MGVFGISSVTTDGSGFSSSWFTATDPASGRERLGAVVLWRNQKRSSADSPPRGFMIASIVLPRFLIERLMPLWIKPPAMPSLGEGWTSSSGEGENTVRYDRRRNVVGIRSRVFGPPPDGHALLLLVEPDASAADGIRIVEHAVAVPLAEPQTPIDRNALSKDELSRIYRSRHSAARQLWMKALEADERYQRFMRGE